MWIYIMIGLVILLLVYGFIMYNYLIKLNNAVKEAFSTMDVYLKKRWDLIPNLVETVKGYAEHEKDTLKEVVELRNSTYDNMSNEEKVTINNQLAPKINKLMALVESYPELKASNHFKNLSKELIQVEDDIENARKYYNGTVRMLNDKIQMVPSNIIARLLGFKEQKMFEAKVHERENVTIKI